MGNRIVFKNPIITINNIKVEEGVEEVVVTNYKLNETDLNDYVIEVKFNLLFISWEVINFFCEFDIVDSFELICRCTESKKECKGVVVISKTDYVTYAELKLAKRDLTFS